MQADVVAHHCFAIGRLCHGVDDLAHQQLAILGTHRRIYHLALLFLIQGLERFYPLLVLVLLHQLVDAGQALLAIANHGHVGLHVLVYLCRVNVKVYHLGLFGILVEPSRNTVGEAHAYGYQHVTLLLLDVWRVIAVHAEHAHVQGMV